MHGSFTALPRSVAALGCVPTPCCCDPWSINADEIKPLTISFAPWLKRTGWPSISEVRWVELLDLAMQPPSSADPNDIRLVSGIAPAEPMNPWPGYALILDGHIIQFLVEASPTIKPGRMFRLNVKVAARDCSGRAITALDCVAITIGQC